MFVSEVHCARTRAEDESFTNLRSFKENRGCFFYILWRQYERKEQKWQWIGVLENCANPLTLLFDNAGSTFFNKLRKQYHTHLVLSPK